MLLRMQIPACSHGGSHFALGSKTNPTATPRGASEPAAQTPAMATTEPRRRSVEPRPGTPMILSLRTVEWKKGRGRRQREREAEEGDGGGSPLRSTETPPHVAPAAAGGETPPQAGSAPGGAGKAGRGGAGRLSGGGGGGGGGRGRVACLKLTTCTHKHLVEENTTQPNNCLEVESANGDVDV